jgi:hypothetical protein
LNVIGPERLRTVRSRSRAFTGVRLPQRGQALGVGFSGFIRDSIQPSDGWPVSPLSFSTASAISLIEVPDHVARTDHVERFQRRHQRRGHRNLAPRPALRGRRLTLPRLLVHGDRSGDQVDVAAPVEGADLTDP